MQDPKAIKKALLIAKGIPSDFLNRSHKEVTKRIPEMEEGAKKVRAGEMSGEEYQALVNKHKPVYPYKSVPKLATHEEMFNALKPEQRERIGKIDQYPEGHPVRLRLDIPAYSNHGVWVPTIHNNENTVIAHQAAAHVKDASFSAPEKAGLAIASGAAKGPYATIKGSLQKTPEADIHKLASQYLNHPDWRQVGMDPTRHGYFYDRHTQQPVEHAEEVLQVGPLVLAKKPKYGDKSKYKYADGGIIGKPSRMQRAEMRMQQGLSPIEKGEANINAYHGTPNTFSPTENNPLGEFSPKRIGVGSGLQLYGHGHYFSESPEVAKPFQKLRKDPITHISTQEGDISLKDAINKYFPESFDNKSWHDSLNKANKAGLDSNIHFVRNILVPQIKSKLGIPKEDEEKIKDAGGHMLTVHIPDEHIEKMLDFDKKFEDQSDHVKNALISSGIYDKYHSNITNPEYSYENPLSKHMTGQEVMSFLGDDIGETSEIAKHLSNAGILGVKFMDVKSANKGKAVRNFVVFPGQEHNLKILDRKASGGEVEDYRGEHKAPSPDGGSPMHDLTGTYPHDFYGPMGFRYYADFGNDYDRASYLKAIKAKGNPNDKVVIYRALPKTVHSEIIKNTPKGESPLNRLIKKGDWVTTSKEYAREHGEANLNNDFKIVHRYVPAKHLYTNGDSIHEWGYFPSENIPEKGNGGSIDDDLKTARSLGMDTSSIPEIRKAGELKKTHQTLGEAVRNRAQKMASLGDEYHKSGKLPLPVGTRFLSARAKKNGWRPYKITGHYVDPKDPETYGYFTQRGEESDPDYESGIQHVNRSSGKLGGANANALKDYWNNVSVLGGPSKAEGGAVDRKKNLDKFLEGSKERTPMYHVTKGNFSKFNPSHRGAHFVSKDMDFLHEFGEADPDRTYEIKSGTNFMPLHVSARHPFDYENKEHVHNVAHKVHELHPGYAKINGGVDGLKETLADGHWSLIENPAVQHAIKSLGHDSFYVNEGGTKNLGVYNPTQLKSAIGNSGTFDPNDPDITKEKGGYIDDAQKAIRRAMIIAKRLV